MHKLILSFSLTLLFAACNGGSSPAFKVDKDSKTGSDRETEAEGQSKPANEKAGLTSGGYTYSWTPEHATGTSAGMNAGVYSTTVTDANACVTYASGTASTAGKTPSGKGDQGPVSTPVHTDVKTPEMIIRTGNLNFSVEDYKKSRAQIDPILKSHNAFIASENESNSSYSISNTMIIRVLNRDFESLVNGLSGIAKVITTRTISTQDVTAEYVDIQARLKTKKEIDAQYLELLRKAVKISDIIEIEDKERVIREEIEAKEGELRLLKDQVSYSTINLVFYQNFEVVAEEQPGFFHRTGSALAGGWVSFLNFIVGVLYAWPAWIIMTLLIVVVVKVVRRMSAGKKEAVVSEIVD